jgi:hypothetical protein
MLPSFAREKGMFLKVRKALYLLLSIGGIGGAFLAAMGLFVAITLFAAGISAGSLTSTALGVLMILICVAGATSPVWVLITIVTLPDLSTRERRVLTVLLGAAILAAGGTAGTWMGTLDENLEGIGTPIVTMVMPMLVGCALVVELWLPVWRARRASG